MNFRKFLFPLLSVMGLITASLSAQINAGGHQTRHDEELNERDLQALREFINSKRVMDVQEKSTELAISGDVRSEWRHMTERYRGLELRGHHRVKDNDCVPISKNDFDVEFNLRFDYVTEKAWAVANLDFDNSSGIDGNICECFARECFTNRCGDDRGGDFSFCREDLYHGSGRFNDLNLKRAYLGYNVFKDCGNLDVEIGRRPLYDIFESEIEFLSNFDGIFVKYSNNYEAFADFYISWGGFVVDERVNHFAWVTEMAAFNIMDYGIDFKYSFINWGKRGRDRCDIRDPYGMRYRISQIVMTYHFDPEWLCRPAEIYGAVLYNHGHPRIAKTTTDLDLNGDLVQVYGLDKRPGGQRFACYAGITVGQVLKEGDWSIDFQYQYVQRNAISWDDQSGIGLGNILSDRCGFFPTRDYQGVRFDSLYAITDELTIQTIFDVTQSLKDARHRYSKVEVEAVYAF